MGDFHESVHEKGIYVWDTQMFVHWNKKTENKCEWSFHMFW